MMTTICSTLAAPASSALRAALFAAAAIVAVGVAQLWQHHAAADLAPAAPVAVQTALPLVAAPSPVDMWQL